MHIETIDVKTIPDAMLCISLEAQKILRDALVKEGLNVDVSFRLVMTIEEPEEVTEVGDFILMSTFMLGDLSVEHVFSMGDSVAEMAGTIDVQITRLVQNIKRMVLLIKQ